MKRKLIKILALTIISALIGLLYPPASIVYAADLTALSDVLTTLKKTTTADHTVKWTLPTSVTFIAGDKARVDFPDLFVTLGTDWATADFTFNDGTARVVESVAIDADPTCTGGVNNVGVRINTATDEFIITACATYTASGPTAAVTFTIDGTTTGGTLTNPNTAAEYTIGIVGDDKGNGFGADDDTGSIVVIILDDDAVAVSGTVSPSLTFGITDLIIGFGTITTANARFATGDLAGADGPGAVSAHNLTIETNAGTGYTVTYNGATLTDTTPEPDTTISVATITGNENGTPGTEQFAIGFNNGAGNATITTAYNQETPTFNYKFVENTTTAIISETVSTITETIAAYYLANIAGDTEAGSYTTSITYIATGNF